MSYDYAQPAIPDPQSLLRENNSLRLTIDSLHDELQAIKFKSATTPNPFLETQLLSLKSENQQLLNERDHLLRQLQSPRHSETSNGVQGPRRDKRDVIFDERRMNDAIMDMRQLNSNADSFHMQRHNSYYGDDDYNTLQTKLLALMTEIERLNRVIREKEREAESSRAETVISESVRITILELENKVVVLSAENERLNAVVSDRNKEIETLQMKLSSQAASLRSEDYLQQNGRFDNLVNEIERLNIIMHEKDREIADLRTQQNSERHSQRQDQRKKAGRYDVESSVQARETQVEIQFLQMENRIKELEQERNSLHVDLEDVRGREEPIRQRIEDLSNEVETWKDKYRNLLRDVKQQEHYEGEVRRLKDEIERSRTTFELKNREIESWRRKYDELHKIADENSDFGKKTTNLISENERINGLFNEKKKELDELKKKLEDFENIEEKISTIVIENQRLVKALNDKASEHDSLKNKYNADNGVLGSPQASRSRVMELERRLRVVEGDNERVKGIYNQKYHETEALKKRVKEIKEQSDTWKTKFYENESALVKVTQANSRLEARVNTLKNENSKLDSMLEEKIKHTTSLQMRISAVAELEGNVKVLNQEKERLEATAEKQRRELGELVDKSVKLEMTEVKLREAEKHLATVIKEVEEARGFLRERDIDIGDLRTTIKELEENSNKVFKLEEVLNLLARENEVLAIEQDDRKREVKEWRDKVKELQSRNMRVAELETRVELMATENERLAENMKRKDREIRESQFLSAEIGVSDGRVRELQDTIKWLSEENERMKTTLEKTNRELLNFESKLKTELRDDKGFGDVIARLNVVETENAGLRQITKDQENEIKNWMLKYEHTSRQLKGEKGLQDKIISLETENDDLRGSVIEKNAHIHDVRRASGEVDELTQKINKLETDKVILSAEIDRLWEVNKTLRKEKEQSENRNLAYSQVSYKSSGGLYEGEGTQESPKRSFIGTEEDSIGGTGEGFFRENNKLKRQLANKERELEYLREKSAEFDKAEGIIENLEGKLEMILIENEDLKRKIKETTDRLSQRLREKEMEIYDLRALLESQESARTAGANNEAGGQNLQNEELQKEIQRLTKANKDQLKEIDTWKGKHLALEKGYFRIGELEVRLEQATSDAEKFKELLADRERELRALKRGAYSPENEDQQSGYYEEVGDSPDRERFIGQTDDDELYEQRANGIIDHDYEDYDQRHQNPNIDDVRRLIERKEKEIRSVRGDDSLMKETLDVIGRSASREHGN